MNRNCQSQVPWGGGQKAYVMLYTMQQDPKGTRNLGDRENYGNLVKAFGWGEKRACFTLQGCEEYIMKGEVSRKGTFYVFTDF